MITFKSFFEEISKSELNDIEKFADRILKQFNIDVAFTNHFIDRVNDSRNDPEITVTELKSLFKKIRASKTDEIKKMKGLEVVLKDMQSDLNLPVVVNYKNGEFEVVNKTIMRKKDFKTNNKVIKV